MKKPNLLTIRNLKEYGIYTRKLNHVTIEVTPCVEFIYNDIDYISTVDIAVRKNDAGICDYITTIYDVDVKNMKKVLADVVETFASDNYMERFIIENKHLFQ